MWPDAPTNPSISKYIYIYLNRKMGFFGCSSASQGRRVLLLFVLVLFACLLTHRVEGIQHRRQQHGKHSTSQKFLDINGIINKVANWPIDKFPQVKKWIEHGLKTWTLSNFTTIKNEVAVHINLAHANNARLDKAHTQTKHIIKLVETSKSEAEKVEAMAAGQIAKLRRDWANEDVRTKYEALRLQRSLKESKMEIQNCSAEQNNHLAIFSAIALQEEVDGKTCINKNRDEIIEAFCNFRGEFDKVLQNRNLKDTKHYWPNICCKGHNEPSSSSSSRNSDDDESCSDPSGTIKPENIVPFALAQGGKLTYEHLYGEVADILNTNGYLHEGMKRVMKDATETVDINQNRLEALGNRLAKVFGGMSLCGPRVFTSPTNSETKMCEMFYPYKHLLHSFHNGFEGAYDINQALRKDIIIDNRNSGTKTTRVTNDASSLIETMMWKRETQNEKVSPLETTLKMKQQRMKVAKQESSCPIVRGSMSEDKKKYFGTNTYTLDQYQDEFCNYEHLDLADSRMVNFAMLYAGNDFDSNKYRYMNDLAKIVKFEVTDACSSPLFSPNDISLQNIAVDGKKNTKWLGIIKLDSTTKSGYLHNLLRCRSLNYIPRTQVGIRIFVDPNRCCEGTKDASECKEKCTSLKPMKHHFHKENDMVYTVDMKGTHYDLKTGHGNRRRRMLWSRRSGC